MLTVPSESLQSLEARRDQIKQEILALGDLRPGSLTEFYRKCGKPTCACAQEGGKRHGPAHLISWKGENQKSLAQSVPERFLDVTQKQIDEYHRFRTLSKELVAVSEQICRLKILREREGSVEAVKKNRSGGASGRNRA